MLKRTCTHPWEFYAEPVKIFGNLYYIGNTDVSVHLLAGSDELTLIDTAFPQTVYQIFENIRLLGFDPKKIKNIIHTHAHYDHCGGTKSIAEYTGAKTWLGKDDIGIINKDHAKTWADQYGMVFYEEFNVDYPITDGQTIKCGCNEILCVSAPGHTNGTTALFFDVTENGKTCKVGLHGGPGLNTLSREYMIKYGIMDKNRTDYLESVEKLKKLNVDIMLGAHPSQNRTFDKAAKKTGNSNPFIDSGDWMRYLTKLETEAKELFAKDK